jgi:tRNA(adenine34) deaminase
MLSQNGFTDQYFMGEALKQAVRAMDEDEIPVGCVIVCNNRIIAKSYNQTEKLTDTTAHAEMIAITAASEYLGSKFLHECTMYITLEPCLMCAGAIAWSRVGRVVVGASEEKSGFISKYQLEDALHPKTSIEFGLMEEESRMLLQEFFYKKRKGNKRDNQE